MDVLLGETSVWEELEDEAFVLEAVEEELPKAAMPLLLLAEWTP